MPDYVEISEARTLPGLRLVVTAGVPGPWGEAAKAILKVKRLPHVLVRQTPGASDEELWDWTRQTSAPVAMWEDERPRSGWADILFLAERLAPEPRLIPEDRAERSLMFGLCDALCNEGGFAWERRLMLLHPLIEAGVGGFASALADKYGYSPEAAAAAPARTAQILTALSEQLRAQSARGSRFFVGDSLTALDIYWATFAAMVEPLPDDVCPMDAGLRRGYTLGDPEVRKAADPALLEHRDFIYREVLGLPMDF
jgi:glutathione S-transferase